MSIETARPPAHPDGAAEPRLPLGSRPTPSSDPLPSSPVDREWSRVFQLEPGAAQLARLHGRTRLTMLRWPGNRESATQVVGILVGNAVKHADPGAQHDDRLLRLRLAITEDHALLIDVEDPLPEFRHFERAQAAELGCGLWTVRRLGGALSWHLCEHGGKAVRARLIPGLVQP